MNKIIFIAVCILLSVAPILSAQQLDSYSDEENKWMHWQPTKATTPIEIKYDKNGNGWIEPIERREMLKDTIAQVKEKGTAKVESPIQAQYDKNKNGVIDVIEVKMIQPDID